MTYDDGIVRLVHGDCIERMRELAPESVDAVVCDPPYELAFMGRSWDKAGVAFDPATWREALRVAKPGAHLLAFGGTRTYHRLACAIEDAGWEIRDTLVWGYASGFPKSLDVSKAIDKAAGAEREVVAIEDRRNAFDGGSRESVGHSNEYGSITNKGAVERTAPATPEAQAWAGWGTALKPAWEPIVLARKPMHKTVAQNVLTHGTGALNIDATRIPLQDDEAFDDREGEATADARYTDAGAVDLAAKPGKRIKNPTLARYASGHSEAAKKALGATVAAESESGFSGTMTPMGDPSLGRWPANVILTDNIFDGQYPDEVVGGGSSESGVAIGGLGNAASIYGTELEKAEAGDHGYPDVGGKSRFFLVPKESRAMRERGLEDMPEGMVGQRARADGRQWDIPGSTLDNGKRKRANTHPTVKPIELMRHLVRLVTPRGGLVLDPFVGSGTTALACSEEGFRCIGIDQDEHYLEIAEGRLQATPIGLGLTA